MPFQTIPKRYGLAESMRRATCNKNWVAFCIGLVYPADISPSMSFVGQPRLTEDPSGAGGTQRTFKNGSFPCFKDNEHKHSSAFEAANKAEALDWMEAKKAAGLMSLDQQHGQDAFQHVLPAGEKRKGLTNDGEEDNEDDGEGAKPNKATAKITAAADEAEVLSDLGQSKNKELAAKRVVKMITVLKSVN